MRKNALLYADISATNHFAIDDQTFADLRRHFTEAEIVELGMFIAYFIGFGRLAAAWDMVDELPESFQDKTAKAAPWMHAPVSCFADKSAPAGNDATESSLRLS